MLGLSAQGYYQWLKNPVCHRDWDDAQVIDALLELHVEDPTLGYRFLTDEFADEHGIVAGENRVWRLCSVAGIFASHHRRRGKAGKPGPPVHDDLLAVVDQHGVIRHQFVATAPNQIWLTDIPPSTSCREVPPPSTPPGRASSISARSRTSIPTGSSATQSTTA